MDEMKQDIRVVCVAVAVYDKHAVMQILKVGQNSDSPFELRAGKSVFSSNCSGVLRMRGVTD